MRRYSYLFVTSAVLALAGCAAKKTPPPEQVPVYIVDNASSQLAEAASSVSRSLHRLAEIEKASTPPDPNIKLVNPETYNMPQRVSLDWNGPMEKVIEIIAKENNYRVRTLGIPPTIPILINIHKHDVPLADIIRDIDYQSGARAQIKVYPRQRIIEIRYAPV